MTARISRRKAKQLVKVTRRDIAAGEPGNCFRCAVALAIQRATGDDHANIYACDWLTYIEAHCRHILAPPEVQEFMWNFDSVERKEDGRILCPSSLKPFSFHLPSFDSPDWLERCYRCEELFAGAELDDEGVCEECRDEVQS